MRRWWLELELVTELLELVAELLELVAELLEIILVEGVVSYTTLGFCVLRVAGFGLPGLVEARCSTTGPKVSYELLQPPKGLTAGFGRLLGLFSFQWRPFASRRAPARAGPGSWPGCGLRLEVRAPGAANPAGFQV